MCDHKERSILITKVISHVLPGYNHDESIDRRYEKKCINTGDLPGAYLHAHLKDFTLIRFEGETVDIDLQHKPRM